MDVHIHLGQVGALAVEEPVEVYPWNEALVPGVIVDRESDPTVGAGQRAHGRPLQGVTGPPERGGRTRSRDLEHGRRAGLDPLPCAHSGLDGQDIEGRTGRRLEPGGERTVRPPLDTVLGAPFDRDDVDEAPSPIGLPIRHGSRRAGDRDHAASIRS